MKAAALISIRIIPASWTTASSPNCTDGKLPAASTGITEGVLREPPPVRMPAHAAGSGFRRNRQGGHPDRPERHPRPGEQFRTAQRPRHRHPNATGPPAPGHRQIACCYRGRKAARSPHPSQDVQAKPRHLSLASQHYRHGLLGGEEPTERNPVANHKSSWDSAWREKLRRLRQPGSRLPHEGLPPENIHPPAKPLLRGAPL